ncbi:MKRN2 opposite strand, tandem duplicate 1 [Silurus meridionalis]|uniref:MKRN2 opposite strand protein-like C-terminal domain-containing protein n=1 Tax=Silurus meridionalis TaxID=175797 RepID=A0A8T0AN51_SILME|nr:MKRN2 opposite strand, tandem duplicate 1 [Silurus meridionalis]KAF7693208.1 hypothetical protein HF521_008524 [Silurus meridionalis]KAI5093454.1 MKRN2 opposite strand protein-like [Silurus meridionalis]
MEETIVKFRHCGKDIYSFSKQQNVCPACHDHLILRILDAPVALPSPFTNGHQTHCSFLIGATEGPWCLNEWSETELHVGLSDSTGLVYNYTLSGVQRDEHGWEQCVSIQLVPPYREDLKQLWDKELSHFSSLPAWTPERFHEEREFGSCCYGFTLTFINHMRSLDSKAPLSRNEFTSAYILSRMKHASMYIRVYEEISQNGFYIVDK